MVQTLEGKDLKANTCVAMENAFKSTTLAEEEMLEKKCINSLKKSLKS